MSGSAGPTVSVATALGGFVVQKQPQATRELMALTALIKLYKNRCGAQCGPRQHIAHPAVDDHV